MGRLVAVRHAVWLVEAVTPLGLDHDDDRQQWLAEGMPDLDSWKLRPYQVDMRFIAGVRPAWAAEGPDGPTDEAKATVHVARLRRARFQWHLYPESGRWPQCSCCGEPMPCQADLQDKQITASMERVELLERRQAGCCWGCGEPISRRHRWVAYPGENVDHPGGIAVRFHTRRACWGTAVAYERRWLAADPRAERVLTYPECAGTLVVHADGSSQCHSGQSLFGGECVPAPDCQGHLTHDHSHIAACYYRGPLASDAGACTRGCDPRNHPGAAPSPRPPRPVKGQGDLLSGGRANDVAGV